MIERSSEWKHGYNDYFMDEKLVNPYRYHTEGYYEWERGNYQAKHDKYDDGDRSSQPYTRRV